MSGGTWLTQNKVRPGAYINFKSDGKTLGTMGDRGVVTLPLVVGFGPEKQVIQVEAGSDFQKIFGYSLYDEALLLLREALKRAKKVLVYRVNTGTKATKTVDTMTFTAKYTGTRGNDLTVSIEEDIDTEAFKVTTFILGKVVDEQVGKMITDLKNNDYITFSGTGALTEQAGIKLTGGENGTATTQDYADYFNAIQVHTFHAMALPVEDAQVKSAAISFIKRMREDEGKKCQLVLADYPVADYEGVISVKNGVVLAEGITLTKTQATPWVAGATAGAEVNQSNTYTKYEDAVDVDKRYTHSEIVEALLKGEWLFVEKDGRAIVEQDINTFTGFTPHKAKEFRKNRVIRVMDAIGNDLNRIFKEYYLGKVDNNDEGRNLFKAECIKYMETLQNINALQNFDASTDIQIQAGDEIDAVVVEVWVQPVYALEKLYMTVTVR